MKWPLIGVRVIVGVMAFAVVIGACAEKSNKERVRSNRKGKVSQPPTGGPGKGTGSGAGQPTGGSPGAPGQAGGGGAGGSGAGQGTGGTDSGAGNGTGQPPHQVPVTKKLIDFGIFDPMQFSQSFSEPFADSGAETAPLQRVEISPNSSLMSLTESEPFMTHFSAVAYHSIDPNAVLGKYNMIKAYSFLTKDLKEGIPVFGIKVPQRHTVAFLVEPKKDAWTFQAWFNAPPAADIAVTAREVLLMPKTLRLTAFFRDFSQPPTFAVEAQSSSVALKAQYEGSAATAAVVGGRQSEIKGIARAAFFIQELAKLRPDLLSLDGFTWDKKGYFTKTDSTKYQELQAETGPVTTTIHVQFNQEKQLRILREQHWSDNSESRTQIFLFEKEKPVSANP